MSKQLYKYEYIGRPYSDVCRLLEDNVPDLLQSATETSARHAEQLISSLQVNIGGFEVSREIRVEFSPLEILDYPNSAPHSIARLPLRWRAAVHNSLFPSMNGQLEIYPLSDMEDHPVTQLSFIGAYKPPLGALGSAGDGAFGHRLAEASVHSLVVDLAREIEDRLS